MRIIKYKRYWFFNQEPVEITGSLLDLILDVPYLMNIHGVIPPLWIVNFELKRGGSKGGMSIGTAWEPFEIDEKEHSELVKSLLSLSAEEYKKHPLVTFSKIIFDESLSLIRPEELIIEEESNNHIKLLDTKEKKQFITWISCVSKKYKIN